MYAPASGSGLSLVVSKPVSSAGAEQLSCQGHILSGLSSPDLLPGLGFSAADGECKLFVESAPGGGLVAGTTSTLLAPSAGGCSMARRRSTTRESDIAEHKISITQLVQDYLVPVTVSVGEVDMLSQVVVGQLTSGMESSSSSSMQFQGAGATNEEQVNINVPPPSTPAGTPPLQLVRALGTMSFLTIVFVISTTLYQPAEGVLFGRNKIGWYYYYVTLGAIFTSGVGEAFTACWISRGRDAIRRRLIFGKVVLCASVVPFSAILAIGGRCFIEG